MPRLVLSAFFACALAGCQSLAPAAPATAPAGTVSVVGRIAPRFGLQTLRTARTMSSVVRLKVTVKEGGTTVGTPLEIAGPMPANLSFTLVNLQPLRQYDVQLDAYADADMHQLISNAATSRTTIDTRDTATGIPTQFTKPFPLDLSQAISLKAKVSAAFGTALATGVSIALTEGFTSQEPAVKTVAAAGKRYTGTVAFDLSDLKPDTDYRVTVTATTSSLDGEQSHTTFFHTPAITTATVEDEQAVGPVTFL